MATVTFYKTKLNPQNRCWDKDSYERYLDNCDKYIYELNKPVIPNSQFFVKNIYENGTEIFNAVDYNYITYEYNGKKYASFLSGAIPLAVSKDFPTVTIIHDTDYWYFVKINEMDFSIHGEVIRGHVNDIDVNNRKLTLENTYLTPEETVSSFNIFTTSYDITNANMNVENTLAYVYLVVNNPYGAGFSGYSGQVYDCDGMGFEQYPQIPCTSAVFVGAIDLNTGSCSFCVPPQNDTPTFSAVEEQSVHIENIQSDSVQAIFFSEIPPTQNSKLSSVVKAETGEKLPYVYSTINEYNQVTLDEEMQKNIPVGYLSYPKTLKPFITYYPNDLKFFDTALYYNDILPVSNDYDTYIQNGIVKYRSTVYNPISCNGNTFDTLKMDRNNSQINIGFMPDSTHWLWVQQLNSQGIHATVTAPCHHSFYADTTRSYWDRMNMLQSTASARLQQNEATMQLVKATVVDTISAAGAVAGAIATGGASLALSATATSIDAGYNAMKTIGEYQTKMRMAERKEKIAQAQYQNGNVSSYPNNSYYSFVLPDIFRIYLSKTNDKNVREMLHRYGYNTFIQIDNLLENHRRQHFNYVRTNSCEVVGLPLNISQDISNMFDSGVHLWSIVFDNDTVENWEVPNYQYNVIYLQ